MNTTPKQPIFNEPIFILGAGGFAKELAVYFSHLGLERPTYLVDNSSDEAISLDEYVKFVDNKLCHSIIGSGKQKIRIRMKEQLRGRIISFIHPTSTIYGNVGEGSVIAPNVTVAPSASIGKHVLLNYGATCGHELTIGELSVIGPNAAIGGGCRLGHAVYVGSGAMIKEDTSVGDNSIIGMGAVVLNHIPDDHVAIGNPAMIIHRTDWPGVSKQLSGIERIRTQELLKGGS